ncbi:uroporphyrinogen-III synthase [Solimonas sp. K1W22B-7]|uniref:uroporphyrinogen-III synthase n=1 Tax=Solimonas sp. K1W22B-7 TaxID=2303331 RepID=UPI000E333425|nr:uroporphyrinogen-III synthase [Solimonas sp. K1W22B-7]AXQ31237.1 uroporphyrinogen-III synthase [Solimonas sp. K1W22B-7]
MNQPPLAGLGVMVTRPAEQAEALCRLLLTEGAVVRRLPLLAIEPARAAPGLLQQFAEARDADAWIFTSRNAVRCARRLDTGRWPARLYAVGAATAAALEELDLIATIPPGQFSGEGLLAHPSLQQPAGQRFLLVTGTDGLGTIAEGLRGRGARVTVAEVYRRQPVAHAPAQVEQALQDSRAILLTSGEALQLLLQLTPEPQRGLLRRRKLVVPSARVVEQALELGFELPLVPEQVSDAAYLRCLERWWTEHKPA